MLVIFIFIDFRLSIRYRIANRILDESIREEVEDQRLKSTRDEDLFLSVRQTLKDLISGFIGSSALFTQATNVRFTWNKSSSHEGLKCNHSTDIYFQREINSNCIKCLIRALNVISYCDLWTSHLLTRLSVFQSLSCSRPIGSSEFSGMSDFR